MENKEDHKPLHPNDLASSSPATPSSQAAATTTTTTTTTTSTTTTTCPNNNKQENLPPSKVVVIDKSQFHCNNWKSKGRCKRKEKGLHCPYRHDESIKQIAINKKRSKMILNTQLQSQQRLRREKTTTNNNNNKNNTDSSGENRNRQQQPKQQQHPLGICFCFDHDDDHDDDSSSFIANNTSKIEPKIIYENGLRHIEPYWIIVSLSLQKYVGLTIDEALLKYSSSHNKQKTKRPPPEYWKQQLHMGSLMLYENNNNHIGYKIIATPNHIIEKSNILKGKYHYHEESILLFDDVNVKPTIIILYEDSEYLIINKPAGIDVLINQNAGRVYNSLPGLVYTLCGIQHKIYPAHRIDNNVSGIVCCGKTINAQKRLTRRIQFHETIKTYLACVRISSSDDDDIDNDNDDSDLDSLLLSILQKKKFPVIIDVPLGFDSTTCLAVVANNNNQNDNDDDNNNNKSGSDNKNDDFVNSDQNNSNDSFRNNLRNKNNDDNHHRQNGRKECKTTIVRCLGRGPSFQITEGDGDGDDDNDNDNDNAKTKTKIIQHTAILEIQPNTGRKHQLRKHLQHVGLCIANDERYGGCIANDKISAFWGTATETTAKTSNKEDEGNNDNKEGDMDRDKDDALGNTSSPCLPTPTSSSALEEMLSSSYVDDCSFCTYAKNLFNSAKRDQKKCGGDGGIVGTKGNIKQPQHFGPTVSTGIWLHSWRYEFPTLNLSFETPIPDWATGIN